MKAMIRELKRKIIEFKQAREDSKGENSFEPLDKPFTRRSRSIRPPKN